MRTVYVCHFMFDGTEFIARSMDGVGAFMNGFWLNEFNEYTKNSDALTWIPPHAIRYVTKVASGATASQRQAA